MSSSLEYYVTNYADTNIPMILGIVLAAATAWVIFGGVHRIGFISSVVVPVMATLYILMAIVNIIAIFMLGKVALKVLKHYEKKRKAGEDPVFYEDEVGLTGTIWTRDRK